MDMLGAMHLVGALIGAAIAAFLGTARNRAKMGEIQKERQEPLVYNLKVLSERIDAKDQNAYEQSLMINDIQGKLQVLERVLRRTERKVENADVTAGGPPILDDEPQTDAGQRRIR